MTYVDMYSFVWIPFASVLTPIFYLYYAYYLNPSKSKIELFEKLLFLPFLIFLTLTIVFRIGIILGSDFFNFRNLYLYVIRINEIFSVLFCFTFLIIPLVQAYVNRNKKPQYDMNYVRPNLDWLYVTFVILGLLTIYWGYLTYRNLFTEDQGTVNYYFFWVGVSISIYWLGYFGIYKYGILVDRKKIRRHSFKTLEIASSVHDKNKHVAALENLLLKEKKYLDPQLSLETVAENLNLSKSHLSRIISSELDTSFTDYINSFRIAEAKNYLINPEFSNYTIVAIGLEAGFNSKSSFFEVFKKATGMTPSVFKKKKEKQLNAEAS
ncbi:MAG: helix-turn-helix transcriptional regulator [Ignavibacteria bacterium]|nr:helix-turn-helix transcriptional regulator [Ignavibacteria bacterium]